MTRSRTDLKRDLFLRLLELSHFEDPVETLEEILALAAETTGARQGYLEIYTDAEHEPRWSTSRGMSEEDLSTARERVSRGIIAEAISAGKTVHTPSALLDDRFSQRASVRSKGIEAVLCSVIGWNPIRGVVYLEGQGQFDQADVELLKLMAKHVAPVVERLVLRERTRDPNDPTQEWRAKLSADRLVGRSVALAEVLRLVSLVAPLDVGVLLRGASGTGKTLVARTIHDNGPRSDGPFVEINCAAIPETLVESELFGSDVGGTSTAFKTRAGRVAAAEGGTLFLDEVAELPLGAQAKLLQLLQSRTYNPLARPKAVQANIRVIAATNADLVQRLSDGRFREDLYHRLDVIGMVVPSIAQRREDIVPIAEQLIARVAMAQNLAPLPLTVSAQLALELPEWTGNVREIENTITRGLIHAHGAGAAQIEPSHLFAADAGDEAGNSWHELTRRFHKSLLERVLREEDWDMTAAAKRLQVARSHIYNLIKTHGLKR